MLAFYKQSFTPRLLAHFKYSYSALSASSSPSPRLPLIRFRGFTACAASAVNLTDKGGGDTFFAEGTVSWKSLGLSERLSEALSSAGFDRPSLIQAACIPPVLSGKDVIIAAETGSGKTHGYLAPLIDKLCSDPDHSWSSLSEKAVNPCGRTCLVLCPNVLLCEQVARMANDLPGDDGKPLLKAAAVCGRQGWPVNEPDMVVSTPAALLNSIDPKKSRRIDFIRSVKYVVFDEADMLLCGSFQNQVIRLINMLRFDEKQLSQMKESGSENATEVAPDALLPFDLGKNDESRILSEEEVSEDEVDVENSINDCKDGIAIAKDWRRVTRKYARSKQYMFVAATLPVNGKKTAGAVLKKMFPNASWISGNYLHQHNPRLKQKWVEVTIDRQVDALIDAVKQFGFKGSDYGAEVGRTMVFANTVDAVEAVAKILERAGIECYRYHKELSLEERAESLLNFKEKGGNFVCTDAAARGIDIPNVSHVIQADFATSAVDFLHRIGRTARAGQYGLVTNLYTESNKELVSAIREAGKLGQPVETAFSRKRSFRNKLKKRDSLKAGDVLAAELMMA